MTRGPKVRYSEQDAARKLNIPVEQLRELVTTVLVTDPEAQPVTEFLATDLVLLQVLCLQRQTVTCK